MTTIKANVSKMFENIGPRAGELTWSNSLRIAAEPSKWLESSIEEATEGMQEWADSTGADFGKLGRTEALALFVQNVASELREAGADDVALPECDFEKLEGAGYYFVENGDTVKVEYYTEG